MEGDICEEQRKRMVDVCCLQEVRWRGQGARDERKETGCGGLKKEIELVVWESW